MALGIVFPSMGAGLLALMIYFLVADPGLISAFAIFFAASGVVCVLLGALVAARQPMRLIGF